MFKTTLATLAVVATLTATVLAQPRGEHRRIIEKELIGGPAMLKEKLNLTDEQETKIQKLRIELMKKQTQLRSRVQTLRLDSKELFLADKVDRKALESNIKAISDAQEQMKLSFVDHWFAVNAILNADQQKIWKQHAMQMGERMKGKIREGLRQRMRLRMHDDPGSPEQDSDL